jgi:cobalt-zinc-cadmium efflux system outer membrane protein
LDFTESPSVPATREITFEEFMAEVLAANLDYAAQRYNVDLVKADAAAAHLWPNPTLALSANRDLTFHGKTAPDENGVPVSQTLPESRSIGLTQTLDLAGKRRWRIRTADQTYHAAVATLEDFLRNLQLDATAAFTEALATRATVEQQRQTGGYLAALVQAQRVRFEKGDLSEADYLRSRLDELQLQNDLRQAEAAATAAQFALCTFLGRNRGQTTLIPSGELQVPTRNYDPALLIAEAFASRPDLVAFRHARDATQSAVHAAKAGRFPDVDVGATYTASSASENFIAPSPRFNQLEIGVSLPLPLWNRNQYEIRKAQATAGQTQRQLDAAELRAEVEIRTAHSNYRAALDRVRQFEAELLRGAETVVAARRFSYERGQTSLLELLEAQRTANDVQQSYHDALADAVKARIELLRAAGLSEANFFQPQAK